MSVSPKLEDEILRYLQVHKIMQLFENLTSCLFYDKPDDPKEYLIRHLKALIKARDQILGEEADVQIKTPELGLFSSANITGMFEMLDNQKLGHINLEKYFHGMTSLGAKNFDTLPPGHETNEITLETFKNEAEYALSTLYAAFQTPKLESLATATSSDKLLDFGAEFEMDEISECEDETDDDVDN